jgi:glycosyltransferase involved in cell wall biosynthesis
VKRRALQWLYPQADSVTAISQGIASELSVLCQLPEDRVTVIPNPVDLDRITRLGATLPDHPWFSGAEPVIVAVGRLHPQKGFVHLIRAFARVRQSLACKLIILGEGPQRTELEQLVDRQGLQGNVALLGFQDNPYSYMAHATAFVLSSIYEGFGTVLVEALTLGTPIVSTHCPVGPDEILVDGQTGLLVPPADEGALAQVMLRLLQDEALRRDLSAAGRQRATDFGLEHIVARYEELIRTVASGGSLCAS